MTKKSTVYSVTGFMLGIGAPAGWILIRFLFFYNDSRTYPGQIFSDVVRNTQQLFLYTYMGIGTAIILSTLGYLIGKKEDELHDQVVELDILRREVANQKEFEDRYKVLGCNFHHISSKIQLSLKLEEILNLCAEGLHELLGYERVNILISEEGKRLRFAVTAGTNDFDIAGITLPLDATIGIIYKCFADKKVYLIDDISLYPEDYHLQPPHNNLGPLRSKSFVLCPIVVKGQSIGVFGIDNKSSRRTLNKADMDTIMLFADQVSSAITRINLLTSIDTLTSEMENSYAILLGSRDQYFRNVVALKENVYSVTDGTAIIASASEGVVASVDETSSTVNEISVAIEQVSRNLDNLSSVMHLSASAMEGINSAIGSIEQNASISHEVSVLVKSQADESMAVVAETINSLAEIQSSVGLSYDAITRLSDNSSRIENIISVINNITKRTKMLALNASIIAAQAGEYGKSFGVVAEEIRNLSLQTGHSTGEIASIIEEIMTEYRTAANSITATKGLVQQGVNLAHSTGGTLKAIIERSVCSMEMTRQIKLSTEEQAVNIQMVSKSMEDISSMTTQIVTSSTDQAKATRSIARSIETIKDMAHEMVQSTTRQREDGQQTRRTVESVSEMVTELFDNMEMRRFQSAEMIKELESMKNRAIMT